MPQLPLTEHMQEVNLSCHLDNFPLGAIGLNSQKEIVYWSAKAAEILEWKEEEVLGMPLASLGLVYDEDEQQVCAMINELFRGNKDAAQFIGRHYTKSGKLIYCHWHNSVKRDEEGMVTSILGLFQDVTRDLATVGQLKESQEQLSLIFNSSLDSVSLVSIDPGGRFRFEAVNKAFTGIIGLTGEQVAGRPVDEVLPPKTFEKVSEKYAEAIRTGNMVDFIDTAVFPAGEKVAEVRIIPVRGRGGQVSKLMAIASDITEKKRAQDKLEKERQSVSRRITAAAIQSQEQERTSISQELHDNVNQVLTTVKLYTELCAAGTVDTAVYLPKCTALLTRAINEIRSISKQLAPPAIHTIGLEASLQELFEPLKLTNTIDLRLDISSLAGIAISDDVQLTVYRIAQEHLTNILKHAHAGRITVQLAGNRQNLILRISDDGIGFDMTRQRTGLGITNMFSRATLKNGTLDISSEKGKGCTLWLQLPLKDNQAG